MRVRHHGHATRQVLRIRAARLPARGRRAGQAAGLERTAGCRHHRRKPTLQLPRARLPQGTQATFRPGFRQGRGPQPLLPVHPRDHPQRKTRLPDRADHVRFIPDREGGMKTCAGLSATSAAFTRCCSARPTCSGTRARTCAPPSWYCRKGLRRHNGSRWRADRSQPDTSSASSKPARSGPVRLKRYACHPPGTGANSWWKSRLRCGRCSPYRAWARSFRARPAYPPGTTGRTCHADGGKGLPCRSTRIPETAGFSRNRTPGCATTITKQRKTGATSSSATGRTSAGPASPARPWAWHSGPRSSRKARRSASMPTCSRTSRTAGGCWLS